MKLILSTCIILLISVISYSQNGILKGNLSDEKNLPLTNTNVTIHEINKTTQTDTNGQYIIDHISYGIYKLKITSVGYKDRVINIKIDKPVTIVNAQLKFDHQELEAVEVFGTRNKQPEKLQTLTRLPLQPNEQIQSISIISDKVIEQQGALTITEVTRNVPGIYAFASYGNRRESMGSRGYRGIPILKNGVRVNSDFRGVGILTDAAGIDNIQVLKGVTAITQGVATDIGSPGGVINIVTKTPKFYSGGNVSVRAGSWGQFRPQFDLYGPIDDHETVAFRINGAYETKDSYKSYVNGERLYVNPSLAWKANDKTTITLEMDYLNDSRTPDMGTVNLSSNDINSIYNLPHNRFLGFKSDRSITRNATYAVRIDRKIDDVFSVRAAYFKSVLALDDTGAAISSSSISKDTLSNGELKFKSLQNLNERYRSINHSTRNDINEVLQLDLVAQDFKIGSIKHTFQVGMDYNRNSLETSSTTSSTNTDIIDVFQAINNTIPKNGIDGKPVKMKPASFSNSSSTGFGLLAQDVTTWNKWFKTFVGIRYSSVETTSNTTIGATKHDAWNPLGGIMVSPIKNINLFASYTNSSNPRTASRRGINGEELGNERWNQFEAGWKTAWMNDRLRFNFTYFQINNKDMNMQVYDATWNPIPEVFTKGGNDERKGIEVELSGRILKNLEIITGYSYIDAKYKEHVAYVRNSAPLNTPKHTFNTWTNYTFMDNALEGLSLGMGVYYIGERPVNDWAITPTHQGMIAGEKPFNMKAYTTVNFQAGYIINTNWDIRFLVNNAFDKVAYNAYRTAYINQIDPLNFAGILTYRF